MTQHTKASHGTRKTEPVQDAAPADQRNEELDADVACCLAEIDAVLEEAESERDRALREFSELKARDGAEDVEAELRVWQAKYAHLQLKVSRSCCGLYAYDEASGRIVS